MKQIAALLLALSAGVVIGAWGIPSLRAQSPGQGTYVVAETHVTDPAGFTEYVRREAATLAAYHGRILARALPDVREGSPPDGIVTLIGFGSAQEANQWFNSPEYGRIVALRQKAATSRVYVLNGIH